MEKLANELIATVEELGLQQRCALWDCTWEESKDELLKRATEGIESFGFWDYANIITQEIRYYTK